jgi:hypothetical protein
MLLYAPTIRFVFLAAFLFVHGGQAATAALSLPISTSVARQLTIDALIDPDGAGPLDALKLTGLHAVNLHDGYVEVVDGVCAYLIPVSSGGYVQTSTPTTGPITMIWDGAQWLVYVPMPMPTIYAAVSASITREGIRFDTLASAIHIAHD